MNVRDFDHSILALEAWQELASEPIEVILCVAGTIVNLARIRGIGIGAAIVEHRLLMQLAPTNDFPDERDPKFTRILQKIESVDDPNVQDLTNGAIYYVNMANPPEWFASLLKKPEEHPLRAVIANWHFFG